jgi:hypothetical protein
LTTESLGLPLVENLLILLGSAFVGLLIVAGTVRLREHGISPRPSWLLVPLLPLYWVVRGTWRMIYGSPRGEPATVPEAIVRPAIPGGIDFVYQVAEDKLTSQLASINELDTKAGVLVGALGAAIGVFISFGHFTHSQEIVIAAVLLLATACAARAFLVGDYQDAPNPTRVTALAQLQPDEIKVLTLQDLLDAKNDNDPKLFRKGRLINASIAIAAIAILYAFIVHAA